MTFMGDLADLMQQDVIYEPRDDGDGFGGVTYGDPVTYKARVVGGHRIVRDASGVEQVSTVRAVFATAPGLNKDGRFTLPSDFSPQKPPAIKVERISDETGEVIYERVFFL